MAASSSVARAAAPSPSCPSRATFMDPHTTLRLARGLPVLRLMGARSESVGWRRLPTWACHADAPGPQHATAQSPHSKLIVDLARRCCISKDQVFGQDYAQIHELCHLRKGTGWETIWWETRRAAGRGSREYVRKDGGQPRGDRTCVCACLSLRRLCSPNLFACPALECIECKVGVGERASTWRERSLGRAALTAEFPCNGGHMAERQ